jgi:hypothetical protein
MNRKSFIITLFLVLFCGIISAQTFVKTADLFKNQESGSNSGKLNIVQDPAIDTLISRYILLNKNLAAQNDDRPGMAGFRIQIYASSNRNAREEANKERAEFMGKFPDILTYLLYAKPGYWKIRAGDFRTKTEATEIFLLVSQEFPNAYLVPDYIIFPDLIKK